MEDDGEHRTFAVTQTLLKDCSSRFEWKARKKLAQSPRGQINNRMQGNQNNFGLKYEYRKNITEVPNG